MIGECVVGKPVWSKMNIFWADASHQTSRHINSEPRRGVSQSIWAPIYWRIHESIEARIHRTIEGTL